MIETKEHYELLRQKSKDRRILDAEDVDEFYETIEALREVARGAKTASGDLLENDRISFPGLDLALAALPDWITESEHD